MRLPLPLPREDRFFGLLRSGAQNVHEASLKLLDLLEHYENVPAKVSEIKRLEEIGDHVIHEIMRNLHRTFVTPIDREDIALLGERVDDVMDAIEEAARIMMEYHVEKPTPRAVDLARIIERGASVMVEAFSKLHFRGAKLKELLEPAIELNRLENEADQIASKALGELFTNGSSPLEILKWREIYYQLELATDKAEDVANVLEGVVLKNA